MSLQLIAFLAICAAACYGVGYEVLVLGDARRSGRATPEDYRRFRRRFLGASVGVALAGVMLFAGWWERAVLADFHALIAWYGIGFILVIWLLIIATRDFRVTLLGAIEENRRITIESLENVERTIRSRQAQGDVAPPEAPPAPAPKSPATPQPVAPRKAPPRRFSPPPRRKRH